MTQLLSGCGSTLYMNSFRSKGDALKFAIEFTSSVIENKVNYDAAQELFDFICRNVPLPDVETNDISEAIKELARLKDADTNHCNCCHAKPTTQE